MKRVSAVWLSLVVFAAVSSTASAQHNAYMLVDQIAGDQPAPHAKEFKLNGFSSVAEMPPMVMGSTGSGISAGKPSFQPVKVSMPFYAASSGPFHRTLATGKALPSIEIRFYNSTNRMFYKTVYENAFLTRVAVDGADEMQQVVEFVFGRVRWFASSDAGGLTAPAPIACWDLAEAKSC